MTAIGLGATSLSAVQGGSCRIPTTTKTSSRTTPITARAVRASTVSISPQPSYRCFRVVTAPVLRSTGSVRLGGEISGVTCTMRRSVRTRSLPDRTAAGRAGTSLPRRTRPICPAGVDRHVRQNVQAHAARGTTRLDRPERAARPALGPSCPPQRRLTPPIISLRRPAALH
jgi:hypothetical protein